MSSADARAEIVVLRGRVVTPAAVVEDGVVVADGPTLVWVGAAQDVPAEWAAAVLASPPQPGGTVLPGLVDLHDHGGGGASFPDATDRRTVLRAMSEHLRHGTTSLVASLVTAPREALLTRAALLAELADAGEIAGIHAEGPFLSAHRCGAQNPADMLAGDPGLVDELVAAARGHLVTMTIAPEVPGVVRPGQPDGSAGDGAPGEATSSRDVLAALVDGGVLPSFGHTDASAEQVDAGIARALGLLHRSPAARSPRPTATHLFNGMRPLHHRDPGPIASCLAAAARGELVVELVADGTHLADGTVRAVFDLVGPDAVVLVTDAMAATGMADGDYRLGPMDVRVADGVARIVAADGTAGAIAGGTAHLLDVVRHTAAAGVPLVDAVRSAATTPAQVLGRTDIGALVVGRRADVVVTDADLACVAVYRAGRLVTV